MSASANLDGADGGIVQGLDNLPAPCRRGVLSVGIFDGVHLGHQAILAQARRRADDLAAPCCALTFDPPPAALLAPGRRGDLVLPLAVCCRLLRQAGADSVIVVRTTPEFLDIEPEAFVRQVLVDRLAARAVVEGPNFFFGRHRSGDIHTLRRLAGEGGFEVVEVPPVMIELPEGRHRVASSLIRRLLRDGRVDAAGCCLGRPYQLHGHVVAGRRRGRVLQFPTANLEPDGVLAPADGVYAARAEVAGRHWPAAVSIGVNPTFEGHARVIEAHLIDGSGDYYGQPMILSFVQRLRPQERFASAEALREQIARDVQRVRELCG